MTRYVKMSETAIEDLINIEMVCDTWYCIETKNWSLYVSFKQSEKKFVCLEYPGSIYRYFSTFTGIGISTETIIKTIKQFVKEIDEYNESIDKSWEPIMKKNAERRKRREKKND